MQTTVELRQNKVAIAPMLWLLGMVAAGICCFLFFSRRSGINPIKIILLLVAGGLVYIIWATTRQLKKDEPLLTFSHEGLEVNESRPVMVLWQDVTSWEVTKSDATYYLILRTKIKRRSINISWLEVQPAEVEALMQHYLQAATTRQTA